MSNVCVFTSSAVNYFPKVRLLCESIKRFHPEWKVYWAVADRLPQNLNIGSNLLDGVIPVETLNIPERPGWIFGHTIAELSTAIKPFVVRSLLRGDVAADAVLFFDPDMVLFSRLDDLIGQFKQHSILLTPHQTKPETRLEAIIDNEICSLRHGIFNLGFLGIRNDSNGYAFVEWWADRLYKFCHESLAEHLWTDQKWINFAPVFFDGVGILKSSRFNVAPWNITTRKVAGAFSTGFQVDDEPLGFYHFTGFDSGAHRIMATKYGADNRAIMELVDWYERETQHRAGDLIGQHPWAFSTFNNGEAITPSHRAVYRLRRDLQEAFPDPFVTDKTSDDYDGAATSYYQWFNWRAALEYPELLHGNAVELAAVGNAAPLSEGNALKFDWGRVFGHINHSMKNRNYAKWVIQHGWKIYRSEGLFGLLIRLCRRKRAFLRNLT